MQRYNLDSSITKSPARWRALFPRPAISRREILARRSAAHLSESDRAYLEAYDVLSAYPGCLQAIYAGLTDAAAKAQARGAS